MPQSHLKKLGKFRNETLLSQMLLILFFVDEQLKPYSSRRNQLAVSKFLFDMGK